MILHSKKKFKKCQISDFSKASTKRHMHAHFATRGFIEKISCDFTNDGTVKTRKNSNVLYVQPLLKLNMTSICIWIENTTLKYHTLKSESEFRQGRKIEIFYIRLEYMDKIAGSSNRRLQKKKSNLFAIEFFLKFASK